MHPAEVRNCILQSLRPDILAGLQPYLRRVRLKRGKMLQEPHRPLDRVYFIEHGMAVLMGRTKRDGQVGVAIIGRRAGWRTGRAGRHALPPPLRHGSGR